MIGSRPLPDLTPSKAGAANSFLTKARVASGRYRYVRGRSTFVAAAVMALLCLRSARSGVGRVQRRSSRLLGEAADPVGRRQRCGSRRGRRRRSSPHHTVSRVNASRRPYAHRVPAERRPAGSRPVRTGGRSRVDSRGRRTTGHDHPARVRPRAGPRPRPVARRQGAQPPADRRRVGAEAPRRVRGRAGGARDRRPHQRPRRIRLVGAGSRPTCFAARTWPPRPTR